MQAILRHLLLSIYFTYMFLLLPGCATPPPPRLEYTPTKASVTTLPMLETQALLVTSYAKNLGVGPLFPADGVSVQNSGSDIVIKSTLQKFPEFWFHVSTLKVPVVAQFAKGTSYYWHDHYINGDGYCIFMDDDVDQRLFICWRDRNDAGEFANAVFRLANPPTDVEKANEVAQFASIAKQYRSAAAKLSLPVDALRFSTQANDALRSRQFWDAISLYEKALATAPWWPEGHYNVALLAAQQGLYSDAVDEMKKYLELAPDAPDAQKAQDQIWIWERRESNQ